MQDIADFLIFGIGFVVALELVLVVAKRWARNARAEAEPAASTHPAQPVSDLEQRQSKRRELLITVLTVAMVIAAYRFFPPHRGFLAAAGAGAIVAIATLVTRAIVKAKP